MVEIFETVMIPKNKIRPNEWNPNVMTADLFNELTENIESLGAVQDVVVAPLAPEEQTDGYEFRIVDGEHRFDGFSVLDLELIPCKIVGISEDDQKFQTVKLNRLRGKFNQKKFTALVKDLMNRYSLEEVAQRMAFTDPTELEAMLEHARESLPSEEMQNEFDKARGEIKTVDDLSMVLNRLFTKYGDTLPYNFMILDFGGKEHMWVRMHPHDHRAILHQARECVAHGVTFDSVLARMISVMSVKEFVETHRDFLREPSQETASRGSVAAFDD
jgi:hypothetical protein